MILNISNLCKPVLYYLSHYSFFSLKKRKKNVEEKRTTVSTVVSPHPPIVVTGLVTIVDPLSVSMFIHLSAVNHTYCANIFMVGPKSNASSIVFVNYIPLKSWSQKEDDYQVMSIHDFTKSSLISPSSTIYGCRFLFLHCSVPMRCRVIGCKSFW